MFTKNSYRGIDPELVKVVRKKTRNAIRKSKLPKDDLKDIEQDLMIALLKGMKNYDPSKSSKSTFASLLADTHLNMLYRIRSSPSRQACFNWQTLNSPVEEENEDVIELIDMVNTDGMLEQENSRSEAPHRAEDIRMDIETVIKKLSENQKQICECLKTMNVIETAKKMKMTKMTVYRKIRQIRELFSAAGLDSCL